MSTEQLSRAVQLANELATILAELADSAVPVALAAGSPVAAKQSSKRMSILLTELGCPTNVKGFKYLCEGIEMFIANSSYLGSMTKSFYPDVAARFDTEPRCVERAMRNAIGIMHSHYSEKFRTTFQHGKPTNSEFLTTIADKLSLGLL